jgi:hypothetical protein
MIMAEPVTAQPGITTVRCRLLRSKWMFIEVEEEAHIPRSDSGICWCVHTQNCLGPDGQVVTPQACSSERPCYEPL